MLLTGLGPRLRVFVEQRRNFGLRVGWCFSIFRRKYGPLCLRFVKKRKISPQSYPLWWPIYTGQIECTVISLFRPNCCSLVRAPQHGLVRVQAVVVSDKIYTRPVDARERVAQYDAFISFLTGWQYLIPIAEARCFQTTSKTRERSRRYTAVCPETHTTTPLASEHYVVGCRNLRIPAHGGLSQGCDADRSCWAVRQRGRRMFRVPGFLYAFPSDDADSALARTTGLKWRIRTSRTSSSVCISLICPYTAADVAIQSGSQSRSTMT